MAKVATPIPDEVLGERLLDGHQVMALLKVSRTTLYELMSREVNPIPSVRIGKSRRFPLDKLRAWTGQLGK